MARGWKLTNAHFPAADTLLRNVLGPEVHGATSGAGRELRSKQPELPWDQAGTVTQLCPFAVLRK